MYGVDDRSESIELFKLDPTLLLFGRFGEKYCGSRLQNIIF